MTTHDTPTEHAYPVRVSADLHPHLSRWLWLVKWLLAIPHYVVLWALWVAFVPSSIAAFFAILFTGRFPRALFDFNVGVMRWTWRVTYYAYGALGTDRYPPFTLSDVADYPAHFDVDYPERLSRGLVLVKWWLLALPHYLVIALFVTGGFVGAGQAQDHPQPFLLSGGLVGLLVLVAALVLLFTGRYPRAVFDLVIGLQRWVLRVAAYAALMTDEYPPFRLDQGGSEGPTRTSTSDGPRPADPAVPGARGRATAVMIGGTMSLVVAGVLLLGAGAAWSAKATIPDDEGFFNAPMMGCRVDTYAITSEPMRMHFSGVGGLTPSSMLGDGRVTVRSRDGSPVFVGVADTRSVETYLEGTARSTMFAGHHMGSRARSTCSSVSGVAPAAAPAALPLWTTFSQGSGAQTVTWAFDEGDWTVVVMHPDRSRGLDVEVEAGATFPGVGLVISVLLFGAAFFLMLGLAMVIGSAAASRSMERPTTVTGGPAD